MPLVFGVFGIKNSTINLVVDLLILFLVVIWLALVYWTYADARRRIADPMLIGCATAASLFPFVGTIVYMIVRPPEYLDDVRERELEMQAAEARLAELGYHLCPHCDYEVEKDFLRCPNCMRKLKDPCKTCGKPLDPVWKICPFCESEIGAVSVQSRRSRRRPTAAEQPVAAATAAATTARAGSVTDRASAVADRAGTVAERDGAVADRSAAIPDRGSAGGRPDRGGPPGLADRGSTAAPAERRRPSST